MNTMINEREQQDRMNEAAETFVQEKILDLDMFDCDQEEELKHFRSQQAEKRAAYQDQQDNDYAKWVKEYGTTIRSWEDRDRSYS